MIPHRSFGQDMRRAVKLTILGWFAIPVTLGRWLGRFVWDLVERMYSTVKVWLTKT